MLEIRNGKILNDNKELDVGHYKILREINRGASGVVFLAKDNLLSRKVAIKVYTKLRGNDIRDKVKQGIEEARKAYKARGENIIEIVSGGITEGLFFVVMEFFPSVPLLKYLSDAKPPLVESIVFAQGLLDLLHALHGKKITHGDLHAENILIKETIYKPGERIRVFPPYKIIDFGTSYFTSRKFGKERHIQKVVELINELTFPFSTDNIFQPWPPKNRQWTGICEWLQWYLLYIPRTLINHGYVHLGCDYIDGSWVVARQLQGLEVSDELFNAVGAVLKRHPLTSLEVGGPNCDKSKKELKKLLAKPLPPIEMPHPLFFS